VTFRGRLILALLIAALVPLVVFALGVRREMTGRLAAGERAANLVAADAARRGIAAEGERIAARLGSISTDIRSDARFLGALHGDSTLRNWMLDYAGAAMHAAGLDMLEIRDSASTVLSAGQYRNLYGQQSAPLPANAGGGFVLLARTPSGSRATLVRAVHQRVGTSDLLLIGGTTLDSAWLSRLSPDTAIGVTLRIPPDSSAAPPAIMEIPMPLAGEESRGRGPATFVVSRRSSNLAELRDGVSHQLAVALALIGILAASLALVLGSSISRPVRELTERAEQVDLDHLDADFATGRSDELGRLSNSLGDMQYRLRHSVMQLRDAERRAATGDLARQVNHDVKNGLTPIRNVLRHLSQLAATGDAMELQAVYREREATLSASVAHLENLARRYAQLVPGATPPAAASQPLAASLADVVRDVNDPRVVLHMVPEVAELAVAADPVAVRRIVHNLVANALESLPDGHGTVDIAVQRTGTDAVTVSVTDTGKGMSAAELDSAFRDFHTTKPAGTGLGLSSVRRLVMDAGGRLRASSSPGAGSRFDVTLPGVAGIDPPEGQS
jgi:signal transduction histidine kinase